MLDALRNEWVVDMLGRQIATPGGADVGVPRDQLTVPIARSGSLTDETFYDGPGDVVSFLPRWRVAQKQGTSPQIVLQQSPTGWSLTVHLRGYAAPSIAEQLGAAVPVPCTYSCLIRYNLAPTAGSSVGAVRELVATELVGGGLELTATFTGTDTAALNQLYSAMTEDEHGTVLVVRRTVTAAVELPRSEGGEHAGPFIPIPIPPIVIDPVVVDPIPPIVIDPVVIDPNPPDPIRIGHIDIGRIGVILQGGMVRVGAFGGAEPEPPAPAPMNDRTVNLGHVVLTDLSTLRGGIGLKDVLLDKNVFVRDRIWWPGFEQPDNVPLFARHVAELDDTQPFVYPPALHPAVYAGVTPGAAASFALKRVEIPFEGVNYPYYQDAGSAATFYYLPDSFKLGRNVAAPHLLMFEVTASDTDGNLDNVKVHLGFRAIPVVSHARLAAAATALRAYAPGPYPPGVEGPQLMPLVVPQEALRLSLLLGGDGGPGGSGAVLSLRNGVISQETLSIAQFKTVYNALFGGIALVSGSLDVLLGAGGASDSVPVELRVADAWGPLVDVAEQAVEANAATMVLLNTVESPVRVESLAATVSRGDGAGVAGAATVVDRQLPVQLAPGESVTVRVDAPAELAGDAPLRAYLQPRVTILPDQQAVWLSVFSHSAPMPLKKAVSVRLPADVFAERPAPNGHPALKGVTVEFEAGVAATFDVGEAAAAAGAPFLTKAVEVPVSLQGYVVAGVAPGTYNYRVAAITANNDIVRDEVPRMSNLDALDVTLPAFPPPA